jgi:hypothetical protein
MGSNKKYMQHIRDYIQGVAEIIILGFRTQDMLHKQSLFAFQPLWVVGIDW